MTSNERWEEAERHGAQGEAVDEALAVVAFQAGILEALEAWMSPADEVALIDELYEHLPTVHRRAMGSSPRVREAGLRVFEGLIEWCGLRFAYADTGKVLLVLGVWLEDEDTERPGERYTVVLDAEESGGGG